MKTLLSLITFLTLVGCTTNYATSFSERDATLRATLSLVDKVQPVCHPSPLTGFTFADQHAILSNLGCLKENEIGWKSLREWLNGEINE